MNQLTNVEKQRQRVLTGILELAVAALELTDDQRKSIEETYLDCGNHLAKGLGVALSLADIFPQGSYRLGTVIRPFRDITEVFDLDLVFRLAQLCTSHPPKSFCTDVGTHLRTKYGKKVKPLPKGWRLDFTELDYYLDIIPAMDSTKGRQVIAITDGDHWRDSNPRGYAIIFDEATELLPRLEGDDELKKFAALENRANIEALPEYTPLKSPLQRFVQVAKRHRDYFFNKKTNQPGVLTPSIILTTLLMKAYIRQVHARVYDSGFDLLVTCVNDMPNHLEARDDGKGNQIFLLPNPSLLTENLVEKWKDQRFAKAFFDWHRDFSSFLQELLKGQGSQRRLLTEALGKRAADKAFAYQADGLSTIRQQGKLSVETGVGLVLGSTGIVSSTHIIHGNA